MAAIAHSGAYSPPTVESHIKELEKIYFTPHGRGYRLSIVFTTEKTVKVAADALCSCRYYADSTSEYINDEEEGRTFTHAYKYREADNGLYAFPSFYIRELLSLLEKKATLEKTTEVRKIPIILNWVDPF